MPEQEPFYKLKILFLESFFGGSHKDFALGLKEHSRHEIDLLTLPDKNWKWRMRGAALEFTSRVENIEKYDLIFATDMINLADFKACNDIKDIPVVLYFHENQLTYPLAPGQKQDWQFGITNITSALCATKILFNSRFQLDEFIIKTEEFCSNVPDFKPQWIKKKILKKSKVLYPGCRFSKSKINLNNPDIKPPLIVWNHRWEWDKNPDVFFQVLSTLKEKKISFKLALLGENSGNIPKKFRAAEQKFKDELISFGYVESKDEYIQLLKRGAVVVSTSIQENFGISVVEAVRMGCIPLLPDRLSYPEIMPDQHLKKILYSDTKDLLQKLEHMLLNYTEYMGLREDLSHSMGKYSWENMVEQYDNIFDGQLP